MDEGGRMKCSALTGSARKIKDNAADWHNLMMRWETLNEEGLKVAGNIDVFSSLSSSSFQDDELLLVDERSSSSSLQTGGAAELQDKCCKLQDIVEKMIAVVTKMERLITSQTGVEDLEEFQYGPDGRKFPLFHSWNTKRFGDLCRVLLEAFSQELKLKQLIQQELAHTVTSDLSMVYLSCWLHQPFIPPKIRFTLEALLLETGHRPL
uniref:Cyclin-dependent kinase 2 interacting protein n=1 Tax=Mola mola TaxID=94237 RepID=A0A3Q3X7A5_MOLML